ncbi:MCP four helix bundle domain-containing protein [Hymenobacter persicinus]|uniref:Chemotaxis methyl-accepting receptor HlyB-like 4HB MCP domain-containing protein n=1 Tax=Hymenobacter persicinus TaxID=2025506 RepID=A0A4V1ZB11_9BACT|nr:MCP four helix bundle domain-containing protein [Hymenobacter persicinus]RYU81842.1 hypothetical protein EWM57_05530 [Hymenobacter persicinus]
MSFLSRIHRKARPVLLFLVVMLGIVGSILVEKRLIRQFSTSVSSLYQDRLLPATGLFQLNDLMHEKRQLLAGFLAAPTPAGRRETYTQLAGRNVQIDSILERHQATYLVADENQQLRAFQAHLRHYNALEKELLTAPVPASRAQAAAAQQFARIHADLRHLNAIQQRVGEELSHNSRVTEGQATLLSNLTIALLLAFTFAIQYALLSDRHPLVPRVMQKFRLN